MMIITSTCRRTPTPRAPPPCPWAPVCSADPSAPSISPVTGEQYTRDIQYMTHNGFVNLVIFFQILFFPKTLIISLYCKLFPPGRWAGPTGQDKLRNNFQQVWLKRSELQSIQTSKHNNSPSNWTSLNWYLIHECQEESFPLQWNMKAYICSSDLLLMWK